MFLTRPSVRPSVISSVSPSVSPVSCHRNSSQTTQQNFTKPFYMKRTYYVDVHIDRKLRFNFFSRSYAPLNLFASMYYCNSLSSQLLSNHTTEFHETLQIIRTYYVDVHINRKLRFNFFLQELCPFELICFNVLLQQFVISTPLKTHNRIS